MYQKIKNYKICENSHRLPLRVQRISIRFHFKAYIPGLYSQVLYIKTVEYTVNFIFNSCKNYLPLSVNILLGQPIET